MNRAGEGREVVGLYLADSWLKDVRLAITGQDFRDGIDDKAAFTAGLRVTSIALRALGVFLARGCVIALLGGNLLTAASLFVLSHDFVVLGNNISGLVDRFSEGVLYKGARKLAQIVKKNITNFPELIKAYEELDEVKDKALFKEVKAGTIMEGWKEMTFSLLESNKEKS
jgi:hypothetical protein